MRMLCSVIINCIYSTVYSELSPLACFGLQVLFTVYAVVSKLY